MKQYYVSKDGAEQQGPIDERLLFANYVKGTYPPSTLVWTEGMSDWMPIGEVFSAGSADGCPYGNPFSALYRMFVHYADFKGRATRKEYWMASLGVFFFGVIFTVGVVLNTNEIFASLSALFQLAVIIPSIAVQVRRLHDIGKTGLFVLLNLIPFVGFIVLLVFCCTDSQRGTNQYGPSEKYPY